jgi:hypothetical protein
MGLALKLYEQLTEAPDDRTRFRLIVDAIGELEEGWPRPGELARAGDVRESELRLQKEIEIVRKEIKEVELRLQKEIEDVRGEIRGAELRLQKEIKEVELRLQREIEQVRVDLKQTDANLRTAMHRQTIWIIAAIGAVAGFIRLLDWLLA